MRRTLWAVLILIVGVMGLLWTKRRPGLRSGEMAALKEEGGRAEPSTPKAATTSDQAKKERRVAAPPPRFANSPTTVETRLTGLKDPRAADYDPGRLQESGIAPLDIFNAEPRDAKWASTREASLKNAYEEDFAGIPRTKIVEMECRTASCKLVVETPTELQDKMTSARRLSGGRQTNIERTPIGDGMTRVVTVINFYMSVRSNEGYAERLQAQKEVERRGGGNVFYRGPGQ